MSRLPTDPQEGRDSSLRAEPGGRPPRTLARKLVVLSASLLVSLAILEVGARLFSDLHPPVARRHPVVGRTYLPGFNGDVFVEESGREVFLRFNREGFRGGDVPYDAGDGVRRIALLGDSFVASVPCAEEDTAVGQLERLLNASRPEVRWEVLNFGVSGASTGQELVLYREIVASYRPDIVVCVYYMGNDFSDNSRLMSSYPRVYFTLDQNDRLVQEPLSAARSGLSVWLNRHSRFYVWQKKANDAFRSRARAGDRIFCSTPTDMLRSVWELNERLIETFHEDVLGRGGRFVMALFPCAEQIYLDAWEEARSRAGELADSFDRDYPEHRLVAICRRSGIPVVPMTEEFRRAASRSRLSEASPEEWLFFGGRGHFNEKGNRLAARAIHDFLTRGEGREILLEVASRTSSTRP